MTFTGVPTFSAPDLLSIFSHTSTVVLPGSSAGLIIVTFADTGSATPGTLHRCAASPSFSCCARLCAMMRLGQQARCIHHRDQRRSGGRSFAGEQRPISHHSVDGAANLRVAYLRLGALVLCLRPKSSWPCAAFSAASWLTLRTDSRCFAAAS